MTIVEAVKICLFAKSFNFEDRGSRAEFWLFYLAVYVLQPVIILVFGRLLWIAVPLALLLYIPQLAAAARRLHDVGRSGWNLLWVLTIIGIPVVLWWLVTPSDPGENRYGEEPE